LVSLYEWISVVTSRVRGPEHPCLERIEVSLSCVLVYAFCTATVVAEIVNLKREYGGLARLTYRSHKLGLLQDVSVASRHDGCETTAAWDHHVYAVFAYRIVRSFVDDDPDAIRIPSGVIDTSRLGEAVARLRTMLSGQPHGGSCRRTPLVKESASKPS
jgi:hypothetical protein